MNAARKAALTLLLPAVLLAGCSTTSPSTTSTQQTRQAQQDAAFIAQFRALFPDSLDATDPDPATDALVTQAGRDWCTPKTSLATQIQLDSPQLTAQQVTEVARDAVSIYCPSHLAYLAAS